ncbi:pentraxin fusion protein-like [Polypterus senegalus]
MKPTQFALFLLISCISVCCEKGLEKKSLIFPEETNSSYVILHPVKPMNLTAFTLCMRLASELPNKRDTILFSYYMAGDALNLWSEPGVFTLYLLNSTPASFRFPQLSTFWTNLCVTWKSSSGLTTFWVNGRRSVRKVYRQGHHIQKGGSVILGQDQDRWGSSFDSTQSFTGEITNVHLWDYALSSDEILSASEGYTEPEGNVIDWNSVEYEAKGNVLIEPVND